ncbi:MAG: hypothetical protein Q4B17_05925 [Lautropia sp.]|nr:hypothetical protein [Lautropia sp.]
MMRIITVVNIAASDSGLTSPACRKMAVRLQPWEFGRQESRGLQIDRAADDRFPPNLLPFPEALT